MQIIHRIDAFLYTLFPQISNDTEIVKVLESFYSTGSFKPKVTIDGDVVIIDIDTEKLQSFQTEFQKVVSLCEKGQFDAAKPLLLKLIDNNPTNSELHRILGQILSEQGDQDEAINALIDALRWDSSNGWALMMMGNIFARHKNDITTALKYYDQAVLVNRADHATLANIAYLLLQEDKLKDAKKYATESLKIKATYPNASFILSLITEKENELEILDYSSFFELDLVKDSYYKIHDAEWNLPLEIVPNFILTKFKNDFFDLPKLNMKLIDLVYFDCFGARVQPDLWEKPLFEIVANKMADGALLTTYSSKGSVRRILQDLNFKVEKKAGPPGKREMINAYKMPQKV